MFRERIRAIFSELSPGSRRLASFILDHYHQAAFMSAHGIGNKLGLDAATVVRFAQRLGYKGYPDLRDAMREAIERDLNVPSTWSTQIPEDTSDLAGLMMALLQSQIDDLKALCTSLAHEDINGAVEKVLNAEKVFVVGEGVSHRIADLFAYGLRAIGKPASLVETDFGEMVTTTLLVCPVDLFVGIACTPLCPSVISIMEVVRQEGVPTLALVGAQSWPLARIADIVLTVPTSQPVVFTHYGAMTVLTKALLDTVAVRRRGWLLEKAPLMQRMTESLLQTEHGVDAEIIPKTISTYWTEPAG
ncbi:MAG: MurR/RpiR family transcriptional regulator [Anaerolineae bacterium]|nr:MurR/RpiR family transcriptional regulator [Anaerolineae bacterium]